MSFFKGLISKFSVRKHKADQSIEMNFTRPERTEPRFELGDGFYFVFDQVSNGMGGYRMINVYLLKTDDPFFVRCIVNSSGEIQNPLGIEDGEWKKDLEIPLAGMKTRFRFWIYKFVDGKASVEWTLQPDGRYFADDDGFGAENFDEITLFSCIDTKGVFTEAFKHR